MSAGGDVIESEPKRTRTVPIPRRQVGDCPSLISKGKEPTKTRTGVSMLRTGLEVPTLLLTWLLAVTSSRLVLGYSNASTPLLDLSVLEELPADELVGSVPQDDDQASGHLRYSLLSRPTAPDGSSALDSYLQGQLHNLLTSQWKPTSTSCSQYQTRCSWWPRPTEAYQRARSSPSTSAAGRSVPRSGWTATPSVGAPSTTTRATSGSTWPCDRPQTGSRIAAVPRVRRGHRETGSKRNRW